MNASHWFYGSALEPALGCETKKRLVPKDTNRFMFIVTTLFSLARHRNSGEQILRCDSFKWSCLYRSRALFRSAKVFREGAENRTRDGRAPHSISELGLSVLCVFVVKTRARFESSRRARTPSPLLLLHHPDVAVENRIAVTLELDGATRGVFFLAAAGRARDLLVLVN